MSHWLARCTASTLLLLSISAAHAQSAGQSAYLTIDGQVETPLSITQTDFQALPHSSVTVVDADGKQAVYSGVDLGMLLMKAGVPLKQDLRGPDVAKYLRAQGEDGFVAVFALPEFDSGLFLVADAKDGSALPTGTGPLQLISPNEIRRSRWVRELILLRIEQAPSE